MRACARHRLRTPCRRREAAPRASGAARDAPGDAGTARSYAAAKGGMPLCGDRVGLIGHRCCGGYDTEFKAWKPGTYTQHPIQVISGGPLSVLHGERGSPIAEP